MAANGWLLAIDTATATVVVAAGSREGAVIGVETFAGGHRHSQELLPAAMRLLGSTGLALDDLAGLIVGTGPGAFTGLRVGLATAKTLAHELGRPIVGISTAEALLDAARAATTDAPGPGVPPTGIRLWLPSGPRDRVLIESGQAPRLVQGEEAPADPGGAADHPTDVAVDLDERAPDAAVALGRAAVAGLPAALLRLGSARLAAGDADDPERLVPAYATPPRGATATMDPERGVAWSRDPR